MTHLTHIYEAASAAQPDHPYLVRKKTGVYGDLRQSGDDLIVPLRDIATGDFTAYQTIQPDGIHNFASPIGKHAVDFTIAGDLNEGSVVVCQNLAAGLSIYELLSCATICAIVGIRPAGKASEGA